MLDVQCYWLCSCDYIFQYLMKISLYTERKSPYFPGFQHSIPGKHDCFLCFLHSNL